MSVPVDIYWSAAWWTPLAAVLVGYVAPKVARRLLESPEV